MTLNARWGLISYQSLLNGVMSLIECLHDNKLLNMSEKILQKARFQKINRKRNLYINSSFVGRSFQKIKRPHLCNSWRTSLFMRISLQEKKLCPQTWDISQFVQIYFLPNYNLPMMATFFFTPCLSSVYSLLKNINTRKISWASRKYEPDSWINLLLLYNLGSLEIEM